MKKTSIEVYTVVFVSLSCTFPCRMAGIALYYLTAWKSVVFCNNYHQLRISFNVHLINYRVRYCSWMRTMCENSSVAHYYNFDAIGWTYIHVNAKLRQIWYLYIKLRLSQVKQSVKKYLDDIGKVINMENTPQHFVLLENRFSSESFSISWTSK